MNEINTRSTAANACVEILDTDFFRALAEPARIQIFRALVLQGRSDIGSIAETMPQDRSVIARHLQIMQRAGLLRAINQGRHTFYEIDGPKIAARVERFASLIQTLAPLCWAATDD
jgi:DNA-binding transcriptional ArsR family regulator